MNIAVILSGGIGTRLGANMPKQYIKVKGKPIISYCLDRFLCRSDIDAFVLVVAPEWQDYVKSLLVDIDRPIYFALPGETRQFSIYNGLKVCKSFGASPDDVVVIHDAVRPLVSQSILSQCIDGCKTHDGVLPVIPVKDTVYYSSGGDEIEDLLDRNALYAGQAPESFLFGKYLRLHEDRSHDEIMQITGSSQIAYQGGLKIKLAKGEESNFKITTIEDLKAFENIIKGRR